MFKKSYALVTVAIAVASGSLFAEIKKEDKELLESFGYSQAENFKSYLKEQMAKQLDLNDDEIKAILEGMRKNLNGEKTAVTVEEEKVRTFFEAKQKVAMEKETERLSKLSDENKTAADTFFKDLDKKDGIKKTASGLRYKITAAGDEKHPTENDTVTIDYVGTLTDGKEFDSSKKSGRPATFPLSGVIAGFKEGLQLVGKGGKVTLYIPSDLAYGEQGAGDIIPPSSALIFEVEVLDIKPSEVRSIEEDIEVDEVE